LRQRGQWLKATREAQRTSAAIHKITSGIITALDCVNRVTIHITGGKANIGVQNQ
jgi:hypothetical protein